MQGSSGVSLYVRRKAGAGQSIRWCIRAYLPALLIVFITLALSFALVFVSSISDATRETLRYLGSGDVATYESIPSTLLPADAAVYETHTSGGVAYSADNTALLSVREVGEDYFFSERRERMKLELIDNDTTLRGIIISKESAAKLNVSLGDRMALLMYETERERARPFYLVVEGIYSSGYSEFDSLQAYTFDTLVGGSAIYEIFTSEDADALSAELRSQGYSAESYRTMYAGIWSNIDLSVSLLNIIVIFVAVLAGFFAVSISQVYVERDARDIASLLLVGFSRESVVSIYRRITLVSVALSALIGMVLGVALSFAAAPILSSLDTVKYPALGNYVLSFTVHIPFLMLLVLYAALSAASYISLKITLSRYVFSSLKEALVS